jgi:hypothetical protein
MAGRNAYLAGVGTFPVDIWDAWYGKYSGGANLPVPPTALGNALTLGTQIVTFDDYWGQSEFILCQFQSASTALVTGTLVKWDQNYIVSAVPSTANLGYAVGFLGSNFPSDSTLGSLTAPWNQVQTTNQLYGWVQIAGLAPALNNGTAATGPAFVSASAGQITSTAAAGKQVLGTDIVIATGGTWSRYGNTTFVGNTINGRTELFLTDKQALFFGITLAGTGIPSNTTISDMQTGRNNSVLMSAAATASGAVTVTPAYTGGANYCIIRTDRPTMQGQIT